MHEMAIAEGILDITLAYAARDAATKVNIISVLIGEMTNIEVESLKFCFTSLAKATIAEKAILNIKKMPLIVECKSCKVKQTVQQYCFFCQSCGSPDIKLLSGRELQVEYLEMD